jgi:hypothetical protein
MYQGLRIEGWRFNPREYGARKLFFVVIVDVVRKTLKSQEGTIKIRTILDYSTDSGESWNVQ